MSGDLKGFGNMKICWELL